MSRTFKRHLSAPRTEFRMSALGLEARRLQALGIEVEKFQCSDQQHGDPSWAHVSGWAQLSGTPRRLSCVLTYRDGAASLGHLLPVVSDTLTELGFPWELTIVDNASTDIPWRLLSEWTELPGFNWMRLAKDYGDAATAWAGLCNARGDAAILLDAADDAPLDRLSELVDRWEQGDEIVVLEHEGADGCASVVSWPQDDDEFEPSLSTCPSAFSYRLILLDRRAIDSLMESRLGSVAMTVK